MYMEIPLYTYIRVLSKYITMTKETKPKKLRVDKIKNTAKVAEILVKNPHKTDREIEKEIWIGKSTVNRAREELGQNGTKDPTIAYIVTSARERIKRVSGIFDKYIDQIEEKDKLERADISLAKDIVKDDMARVTVLWWNATDDEWGLKDTTLSDKQIDAITSIFSALGKHE